MIVESGPVETWDSFWKEFLDTEKLHGKVEEIDETRRDLGFCETIEETCHETYNRYHREILPKLKEVQQDLIVLLQGVEGVHLSTSRIKTCPSLLRKIIEKSYKHLLSSSSSYAQLSSENFDEIVSDLLGLRFIINYRGKWETVHSGIIKEFPLLERAKYPENKLLPHTEQSYQVEWPKVYYAYGDDISAFEAAGLNVICHEKGYRSIHYTLSYKKTYVELQVRTIYDEAWSDVDHRYVYKQEANTSSSALNELSRILCRLTNISNDIGEEMRIIFNGEAQITMSEGKYLVVNQETMDYFDGVLKALEETDACLKQFRERMIKESS